jgi:hypothetical protein
MAAIERQAAADIQRQQRSVPAAGFPEDVAERVTSVAGVYDASVLSAAELAGHVPAQATRGGSVSAANISAEAEASQRGSAAGQPGGASILILPDEIIARIARRLDVATLGALACTCRRLYAIAMPITPGLKLDLFPHQVESMLWMIRREANVRSAWYHPSFVVLPASALAAGDVSSLGSSAASGERAAETLSATAGGSPATSAALAMPFASMDLASTEVQQHVRLLESSRGGLLCDDPGLGKTVTMLALLLKTARQRSRAGRAINADQRRIAYNDQLFRNLPAFERRGWILPFLRSLREMITDQALALQLDPGMTEWAWVVPRATSGERGHASSPERQPFSNFYDSSLTPATIPSARRL